MADLTLTVTDAQLKVLRKLDPNATAKQVLQIHVDTWLLPLVQQLETEDRTTVIDAYRSADPVVRERVKELLGLG